MSHITVHTLCIYLLKGWPRMYLKIVKHKSQTLQSTSRFIIFAWAERPRQNNPLLPEKLPRSIWDAAVINESALDSVTRPGNSREKSKSENNFRQYFKLNTKLFTSLFILHQVKFSNQIIARDKQSLVSLSPRQVKCRELHL